MEYEGRPYPDTKLPCNRENMTKLVEALESGDYPQTQGYLRTAAHNRVGAGYCCAGVACDVSGTGQWVARQDYFLYATLSSSCASATMPIEVVQWLGIEGAHDAAFLPLSEAGERGALTGVEINDGGGTFKKIAECLRQTYLSDEPVTSNS